MAYVNFHVQEPGPAALVIGPPTPSTPVDERHRLELDLTAAGVLAVATVTSSQ